MQPVFDCVLQLLVEFVQNASIPLGQSLEEPDKPSCVPLLSPAHASLCSPLELPGEYTFWQV